MSSPRTTKIDWPRARRIIATRFPPIDLFEDIADPEDWPLIVEAEMKTNPRLSESIGQLDLVPAEHRVAGTGASLVMAPFTHVSTDWPGRFHDGTFGAFYTANRFETAVAETTFHRASIYRASKEKPGWFAQFRELIGRVRNRFHDIRDDAQFVTALNPNDYSDSNALARRLRTEGSNGIVFPSVRDPEGECLAAFRPNAVSIPVSGRLLAYHFDGHRIDLIRDETTKEVFRIEPAEWSSPEIVNT